MADSSLSKLTSSVVGSDDTFDILCYPCDSSGTKREADGYCTDCREHMCETCLKYHTITSLTKQHTLVNKEHMPGTKGPSIFSDVCTQRCQIHTDEVIKYYCTAEKALGCGVCIVSTHDTCKGKLHIPDEAKLLDGSQELTDYQATIENLIKKSDIKKKSSENIIKFADDCLHKALHDIETFRREMNDVLDELKASLEKQAEETAGQDKTTMAVIADETSTVQTELKRMSLEMKTLLSKKQHCQMFIEMKTSAAKLVDIQQQLDKEEPSRITSFRFKPSEDLQKLLRTKHAFGELLLNNQREMKVTHVANIPVKSVGNKKVCGISGATILSNEKLVIADWNNTTVKLVNPERKLILSEYKPASAPNDVANVNNNQVAITVPDAQKILILKAEEVLTLDREISTSESCWFIASMDDKLVVSFSSYPPSVGLLGITGELLKTFSTSSSGESLFSRVPRVTTSTFSRAIYASDVKDDRVLMLDMDGKEISEYRDDDLKAPAYMAVGELGMMYVCGANSFNIQLVIPGCSKAKTLLTEKEGMKGLMSVCICGDTGKLYVGMDNDNTIKVFQLA